jgi:protoheme IX farnesyltransferase
MRRDRPSSPEPEAAAPLSRAAGLQRLKAYGELTKPRILVLLVIVALASFYLATPGTVDWGRLASAAIGISALAAGILALNGHWERDSDRLMRRTAGRPVPSGRLTPREAFAFGAAATTAAVAFIAVRLGWVAGVVAFSTFVSYVLVYTPLKQRSAWHTTIGALSGAMPPLLGWASARGALSPDAWGLFAMLFFWQFPHFLAIATMYGEDYARAGIKVLPAVDARGGALTASLIVASLALLLVASVLPWITRLAGTVYLAGAAAAGVGFASAGVLLLARRTKRSARVVLRASVLYLPIVFALMVFDVAR